jgi:hypothetical protein
MKRTFLFTLLVAILFVSCSTPDFDKQNKIIAATMGTDTLSTTTQVVKEKVVTKKVYINPECDSMDLKIIKKLKKLTDSLYEYQMLYEEAFMNEDATMKAAYYKKVVAIKEKRLTLAADLYKIYNAK